MFIQRQNNSSTILPHETKQALPYIEQNLQATCLRVTVEFAILQIQGWVGVEYFHDLRRRNGCRAKFFREGKDAESKKWDSVHLWQEHHHRQHRQSGLAGTRSKPRKFTRIWPTELVWWLPLAISLIVSRNI